MSKSSSDNKFEENFYCDQEHFFKRFRKKYQQTKLKNKIVFYFLFCLEFLAISYFLYLNKKYFFENIYLNLIASALIISILYFLTEKLIAPFFYFKKKTKIEKAFETSYLLCEIYYAINNIIFIDGHLHIDKSNKFKFEFKENDNFEIKDINLLQKK